MTPSLKFLLVSCTIIISFIYPLQGQRLSLHYVGKLPHKLRNSASIFDGEDSIYIFGGYDIDASTSLNDILRYSISQEKASLVARMPTWGHSGSVQQGPDGTFLFFGGTVGGGDIEVYQFDPSTNETKEVASLPYSVKYGTSVRRNNTIYLLGGEGQMDGITTFDIPSMNSSTTAANLPYMYDAMASIRVGEEAYIIGNTKQSGIGSVVKLNLDNYQSINGPSDFINFTGRPSMVNAGSHVYIIGGYRDSLIHPTNGIIQLTPGSLEYVTLWVDQFPVGGTSYLSNAPDAVYVDTLNRIYFFGGVSSGTDFTIHHDDIWYIDLNPLDPTLTTSEAPMTSTMNPDIFTCLNRPDGIHPHPYDCTMYIMCHQSYMETYTCPPPLLFDPSIRNCNFPENFSCELSCEEKEDGQYRHPYDCSLYVECDKQIADIQKCPPPQLFDPKEGQCNLPELVQCEML